MKLAENRSARSHAHGRPHQRFPRAKAKGREPRAVSCATRVGDSPSTSVTPSGEPHVLVVGPALPALLLRRLALPAACLASHLISEHWLKRLDVRPPERGQGAGRISLLNITVGDGAQDPIRAATELLRGGGHPAPLSPLLGLLAGRSRLDPPATADEDAQEGARANELPHPACAEPEQFARLRQGHVSLRNLGGFRPRSRRTPLRPSCCRTVAGPAPRGPAAGSLVMRGGDSITDSRSRLGLGPWRGRVTIPP
jgi:hypothetical protein